MIMFMFVRNRLQTSAVVTDTIVVTFDDTSGTNYPNRDITKEVKYEV